MIAGADDLPPLQRAVYEALVEQGGEAFSSELAPALPERNTYRVGSTLTILRTKGLVRSQNPGGANAPRRWALATADRSAASHSNGASPYSRSASRTAVEDAAS